MFMLEYKQLYIVPESKRKNRTCQSYRWKQLAMCEEEKPLQDYIDNQSDQTNYRIVKQGH